MGSKNHGSGTLLPESKDDPPVVLCVDEPGLDVEGVEARHRVGGQELRREEVVRQVCRLDGPAFFNRIIGIRS